MLKICPRIDCCPKRLSSPLALRPRRPLRLGSDGFLSLPVRPCRPGATRMEPKSGPDLMGYKVYYGTATGSYSHTVDVGLSTGCLVSGLPGWKDLLLRDDRL